MDSIENHLKDLEKIYRIALANDNYPIALKAKELLVKNQSITPQKNKPKLDLKNYTEQELIKLLKGVEEKLGEDTPNESLAPLTEIDSSGAT